MANKMPKMVQGINFGGPSSGGSRSNINEIHSTIDILISMIPLLLDVRKVIALGLFK